MLCDFFLYHLLSAIGVSGKRLCILVINIEYHQLSLILEILLIFHFNISKHKVW